MDIRGLYTIPYTDIEDMKKHMKNISRDVFYKTHYKSVDNMFLGDLLFGTKGYNGHLHFLKTENVWSVAFDFELPVNYRCYMDNILDLTEDIIEYIKTEV